MHPRFLTYLILVHCLLPSGDAQEAPPESRQTYAAVFAVRGSVVGSAISQFGPFVRTGDTSWQFLARSNVYSFGIVPVDYRSTRRLYLAGGDGLHRSTDGGKTWRVLTGWQTMEVLSVVPDPIDSSLIYIGTPWGVYRSKDDGATWHAQHSGFRRFYGVLAGMDARSMDHLYAMSDDDLYRTTDRGQQWGLLGVNGSVLSFAQHPSLPKVLLAGIEDGGIRRSTDDGRTWQSVNGLETASVYTIACSPEAKDFYAAGWQTGVWKSVDNGQRWQKLWDAPGIEAIFDIHVDALAPDHLFAGTDGQGVFESFDRGQHWRFAGLAGGKVKQITISH